MSDKKTKQFPIMMSVCFWCGKEKDEILIGKRAVNSEKISRKATADYNPCGECKNNMKTGITFIELSDKPYEKKQPLMFDRGYPSGRWAVVSEEGVRKIVDDEKMLEAILEKRKTFVHPEVFEMLFQSSSE